MSDLFSLVKPVDQLSHLHKLKILLLGPSGSGKTTIGAKFEKPLIGVTEHQAIPSIQRNNPNARVFSIKTAEDIGNWRKLIADPRICEEFDAVVLDSLTDCQRIMRDLIFKGKGNGKKGSNWDQWGLLKDKVQRLAREMRDLETHVLVICLSKEKEDENRLVHRPDLQGSMDSQLGQYFNLIGYVHRQEIGAQTRHQVLFDGGDKFFCKTMPELSPVEPPEPLHWISKVFESETDPSVLARVEAWNGQGGDKK